MNNIFEKNNNNQQILLNSWWIIRFTVAGSGFIVTIIKSETSRYIIQLRFEIELHEKDLELLKLIQSYFSVGIIRFRIRKKANNYKSYLWSLKFIRIKRYNNTPFLSISSIN